MAELTNAVVTQQLAVPLASAAQANISQVLGHREMDERPAQKKMPRR